MEWEMKIDMNALKLYCTFEDINNYIRTKVDSKYKNSTFIPIKAEVNENDLSIDLTLVEANSLEGRDNRRFKLELSQYDFDKKTSERGLRVETNPVDDYSGIILINKICESESDHEWECYGMSTGGSSYRCRKCGTLKHEPIRPTLTDIHSTTYAEARGDDNND